MIAHFVDSISVKNSPLMQSALAGSFSYLVRSLDDEQPVISQRTLLNLDSIKTPSLKVNFYSKIIYLKYSIILLSDFVTFLFVIF